MFLSNLLIAVVAFLLLVESSGELVRLSLDKRSDNETATALINLSAELAAGTGSISVKSFQGTSYYGPASLGTPPQNFNFLFATGSGDTWVGCTMCSNCGRHQKYNPHASSTFKETQTVFKADHVQGFEVIDTLTVGGLVVHNQEFAGITQSMYPAYNTGPWDGMFGLGYQSMSAVNVVPVFQNMINQKVVSSGQFSFYLTSQGGEVTFGGYDQNHFSGDIEWIPLVEEKDFHIELQGIIVDNVNYIAAGGQKADIATETSFFIMPTATVDALAKKMLMKKFETTYILNCHALGTYPDVMFVIGGKQFTLKAADMVIPTGQLCMFAMMGMDTTPQPYILGDMFIRKYYTIFDYENKKIGLAPANAWSSEETTTATDAN